MRGARRSVLRGLLALLIAFTAVPFASSGTTRAATTDYVANCSVNLRSSASTSGTVLTTLSSGAIVTATGTVSGSSWSASCPSSVSGSSWYSITAVNGKKVSSLYGVSVAYAATGMFRPLTGYLEGIDVSKWQGTIDFAQVAAAGKKFVLAKATEGIGYLDSKYLTNRTNARAAGLRFTGYHYARPDLNPTNPKGEADWFVDNLGLVAGMLPPALDIEVHGTLSTTAMQSWVSTWLGEVYARTGQRPMIYTSPSFWKTYLGDTTMFADQGYTLLWVAHWFVSSPTVPANNWGGHSWTFWQYTDCGTVPGISGCVDLDRYRGTDLTSVTYGADFALSPSPASVSLKQGASTTFTVNIARTYFTLPIALSVSGAPTGATATLTPTSTTGSSATLAVTTSKSGTITPPGTYHLTVSGTGNGVTHATTATLIVTDGIAPTTRAPTASLYGSGVIGSTTTPVKIAWSASDPSGIAWYYVQRQVNGGAWDTVSLPSATATSVVQSLTFATTYRYRVQATDGNGNTGAWIYGRSFQPLLAQQSSSTAYSGTWTTVSNSYASGGSLKYATASGASATFSSTGSNVSWVAYRGPNRGNAAVYVDGTLRATISLYASSYTARPVVYAMNWAANGSHTLRIVCLGTSGHPQVDVDAFVWLLQV